MIPTNRQIHAKLEVYRPDGTSADVTDYLESADVELGSIEDLGTGTGADIGVRSLTFTLHNKGENVHFWQSGGVIGDSNDVVGNSEDVIGNKHDDPLEWLSALLGDPNWKRNSFAPRDKSSDWNTVNGSWNPLLWPYRPVRLQMAATAPGATPTNWETHFEGYLGDNIATEPHRVNVRCRDKSKILQDSYIDSKKTYEGPISAEALIQEIIDDYVLDAPPVLYCPAPSGITFEKMDVEYVSVWDAIQNVAKQCAWFLGYRWNGTEFALTFMEPPRNKNTADFELNWMDDMYQETLDISDADIRNVVSVTYRDGSTGKRETVTASDPDSIAEYRRRAMQIEEADTSLIDTATKAQNFADACLWDLSQLSATDRLNLPLLPEMDLFSTMLIDNPMTSSTKDFFAVQSVRHSLRFGERASFRTEVIATGRVVGAKTKWQDMETRPGRPGNPVDPGRIPPESLLPDRLPDHSIGVDKFMDQLKPPIMVTSKPNFPDPRYPVDTILFYTVDGKLYRVIPGDWEPMSATSFAELVGQITETQISDEAITSPKVAANAILAKHLHAEAITADRIVAGILQAGGIKADWYAEIRNTWTDGGYEPIDADYPIEFDFYLPSETDNIVKIAISARGTRYRAYARTASSGGGSTATSDDKGSHDHTMTVTTITNSYTENAVVGGGGHTHSVSITEAAVGVVTSLGLSASGSHTHTWSDSVSLGDGSHSHSVSGSTSDGGYLDPHSHSVVGGTSDSGTHSHSGTVSGTTSSAGSHAGHVSTVNTSDHKHSVSASIGDDTGIHSHSTHNHAFSYSILGLPMETRGSHTHEVAIPSHVHGLEFGIYEDTTPNNVRLYCDNNDGSEESAAILATTAPDTTTPYNLFTNKDLTSYFSLDGSNWKRIRLTSSRKGRINYRLIIKVDVTA